MDGHRGDWGTVLPVAAIFNNSAERIIVSIKFRIMGVMYATGLGRSLKFSVILSVIEAPS